MTEETTRAVLVERNRCLECVDSVMNMAGEDELAIAMLNRIKNLINSGTEPRDYEPFRG